MNTRKQVKSCCGDTKCSDNPTDPIQLLKAETNISINESDIKSTPTETQCGHNHSDGHSHDKTISLSYPSNTIDMNNDDKTYSHIEMFHELRILN